MQVYNTFPSKALVSALMNVVVFLQKELEKCAEPFCSFVLMVFQKVRNAEYEC